MEILEETKLLKFNSNTLALVRKESNLDKPGILEQSIDILELWQQKQKHFLKKDFSRGYLERTLICSRGSVEEAKANLDKMCTTRSLLQQYFDNFDVKSEIEPYKDGLTHAVLPNLTPNQERIFFARNTGFKSKTLQPLLKHMIKVFEYLRANDYALGLSIILDISEMNLFEFLPVLNPIDLRNIMTIILDAFGHKLESMHIISTSKFVDTLNNLFTQLLGSKIGKGIFVHKNVGTIYEAFPREMMPKDYGGSEKTLKELNEDLEEVLSSEETIAFFKEMSQARTNEALRPIDTFNEQYMGVPGSFKTLTVD